MLTSTQEGFQWLNKKYLSVQVIHTDIARNVTEIGLFEYQILRHA